MGMRSAGQRRRLLAIGLSMAVVTTGAGLTRGAASGNPSFQWKGGGTDAKWGTATNWNCLANCTASQSPLSFGAAAVDVQFPPGTQANGGTSVQPLLNGNLTIGTLRLQDAWTLAPDPMTTTPTMTLSNTGTITGEGSAFTAFITTALTQAAAPSTGSVTPQPSVTINLGSFSNVAGQVLTVGGGGTLQIDNAGGQAGAIVVNAGSTLAASGALHDLSISGQGTAPQTSGLVVDPGNLTVAGTFTEGDALATVAVAGGRVLALTGAGASAGGAKLTLTGAGTMNASPAAPPLNLASLEVGSGMTLGGSELTTQTLVIDGGGTAGPTTLDLNGSPSTITAQNAGLPAMLNSTIVPASGAVNINTPDASGTGTLLVNGSLNGSASAVNINGPGTTWLKAANNTSGGAISVNSGILRVAGTLPSAVALNGGTLEGSGTVSSLTGASGGTLFPDSAGGPLTASGPVSLAAATDVFNVQLDASNQFSHLNAQGGASFGGNAHLNVLFGPGAPSIPPNTPFTIVQSPSDTGQLQVPNGAGGWVAAAEGASFVVANPANGSHRRFTISYAGGSAHHDVILTAFAASGVTMTTSPNPVAAGAPLTINVTVAGSESTAPSGGVTIFDGTTNIGSAGVAAGFATLTLPAGIPTAGFHSLTAAYSGDSTYPSSTSLPVNQTVLWATTTTVTSTRNPANLRDPVTLNATISSAGGIPTGTVTFTDSVGPIPPPIPQAQPTPPGPTVVLGTAPVVGGVASLLTPSLPGGLHSITATFTASRFFGNSVNAPALAQTVFPPNEGYWLVASDGGIFPFGHAGGFGSTGGFHLNQPIVGMAGAPDGHGYWLVASDGGIFPFGSATGFGSTGGIHLNQPIVGMAATPDSGGYWLVARDGGIFPFGDAAGYGSTGGIHLNQPIVGMAVTADGGGYWLVASDGGIFPFGDAVGYGSTGGVHLNRPIVAMAATTDGRGYWLVANDGGIFPFGDARGLGSTGSIHLNRPIVGMSVSPDSGGYWLVASDGGIFPFGDSAGLGGTGGFHLNQPIVAMAAPAFGFRAFLRVFHPLVG